MPPTERNTRYIVGSFAVLAILVSLSFGNISSHEFLHWDDISLVLSNEYLRPLSFQNIYNIFFDFQSANWHPITWLSYAVNLAIFGESAIAFKITNILIHFLNCILVFYLAYLLLFIAKTPNAKSILTPFESNDRNIIFFALIGTFLFAIHPQHVEPVSWISGRKDLLCTFFYVSAVIAYIHMHFSSRKILWTNIIAVLFACALMSKSMAVTFPVILALLDVYPLNKLRSKTTILDKIKYLLHNKWIYIALSGAVVTITFITQTPNIASVDDHSMFIRISSAATNYFYHVYSIFVPNIITPYHPLTSAAKEVSLTTIVPILLFIALFSGCLILYKRGYKYPGTILLAYFVMLLPAIGLVHVGHASRADRYSYLPTIVIYILLAIGIGYIWAYARRNRWLNFSFAGLLSAVSITFAMLTHNYNAVWANDRTLWSEVINRHPDSVPIAYSNLGGVYSEESNHTKAIELFKKAIQIDPKYNSALQNLGYSYEALKDLTSAELYYKKMIEVEPTSHYPYTVVGDFYFRQRNYPLADVYYDKALTIKPDSEISLLRSGILDYMKGNFGKAEQKIDLLLQLRPHNIGGLQMKMKISKANNDFKTAQEIENKLNQLMPNNNPPGK